MSKSDKGSGKREQSASQLIDERIQELGDWRGEMLARIRGLIKQADPEVVEEWKWRGVPVWYHSGMICTGETYKNVVKVTFAKGASLADPSGLFNSSLDGNTRRAIDFHEHDKIDEKAFKAHPCRGGTKHFLSLGQLRRQQFVTVTLLPRRPEPVNYAAAHRVSGLRARWQDVEPGIREKLDQLPVGVANHRRLLGHRVLYHRSPEVVDHTQHAAQIGYRQRHVRESHFVHDTNRTRMHLAFRIVHKFEDKAIADQISRMHPEGLVQLQKLVGAVVGRFEFPPELESQQALVEAARPLAIRDAESNVVENCSVTGHYSLP